MEITNRPFLIVNTLLLLSCTGNLALAQSIDPFRDASTGFEEEVTEQIKKAPKDWGVSPRRGSALYTVNIEIPPGRNEVAPKLALRYSSAGSLRGGIAAGWDLDLPVVERNTELGYEGDEKIFQASLNGISGNLIEVPDKSPFTNAVAYRVEGDSSFTRFFYSQRGIGQDPKGWVALASTGMRYHFDQELSASDSTNEWHITRQVDSFGNTVRYYWSRLRPSGNASSLTERRISRIEYSSNPAAGLDAYARIDFTYESPSFCQSESRIPDGAAKKKTQTLSGVSKLIAIAVSVKEDADSSWRKTREYRLKYVHRSARLSIEQPEFAMAENSTAARPCSHSPLRYLKSVQVTALDTSGQETTKPPVTFSYNNRRPGPGVGLTLSSFGQPNPESTIDAGGYAEQGDSQYGPTSTLLDVDSDGVRDKVAVTEKSNECVLVWFKGNFGGTFSNHRQESVLPTIAWYFEAETTRNPPSGMLPTERCTLNGQRTFRDVPRPPDEFSSSPSFQRTAGSFSYQYLDWTADGRIDLLTSLNGSVASEDLPQDLAQFQVSAPRWTDRPIKHFRWFLFHNKSERPSVDTVGKVFSLVPFTIDAPVPLGLAIGEQALGNTVTYKGIPPPLVDLDGDGFLDAIDIGNRANTANGDGLGCFAPLEPRARWCVYFGNGNARFKPGIEWPMPKMSGVSFGISGFSETRTQTLPNGRNLNHQDRRTIAGIYDVDSDGLPDLLVQDQNDELLLYSNTGSGFSNQGRSLGVSAPLQEIQTDYTVTTGTIVIDGDRGFRRRLLDIDRDGYLDMLHYPSQSRRETNNIKRTSKAFVSFGIGDKFLSPRELPLAWSRAKRFFSAQQNTSIAGRTMSDWQVESDFLDVTGDGLPDLTRWNADGSIKTYLKPGLPAAPDLLRTVDNGRGLRITYSYSSSSDPQAVSRSNPAVFHLRSPFWVVTKLVVAGGFDTPTMEKRFEYTDAVTGTPSPALKIRQPKRFLGFRQTETTVSKDADTPAQRIVKRYQYNLSPDGREVGSDIYNFEGGQFRIHTLQEHSWKKAPLFLGELDFVSPLISVMRTCAPGASRAACADQMENVRRSEEKWLARTPSASGGPMVVCETLNCGQNLPPELYVRAERVVGEGPVAIIGDRRSKFSYYFRYGQSGLPVDDYRVRVRETKFEKLTAVNQWDAAGRNQTIFESASGLPVSSREWRSDDFSNSARTDFRNDPLTGVLLRTRAPEQSAAGENSWTEFAYDDHKLFVTSTSNPLGHNTLTRHDVATSSVIEESGPNPGERSIWSVDGFGRIVDHSVNYAHDGEPAKFHKIATFLYNDSAFQADGSPTSVVANRLLEYEESTWLTDETDYDGLGRTLSESRHLSSGSITTKTYEYDGLGEVSTVSVLDPRSDDGALVSHTYEYDGAGRLTRHLRPDSVSGKTFNYAGLNVVSTEIASDGSGGVKETARDVFGRVVQVTEHQNGGQNAVTQYAYDANDNVSEVIDADGNKTTLQHDWAGNLLMTSRGSRNWLYEYDLNGNIVRQTAPAPANPAEQTHGATYEFDMLNRVTTARYFDPEVSFTGGSLGFSAGDGSQNGNILYTYDDGENGIGKISQVEFNTDSVKYQYDRLGRISVETRTFNLPTSPAIQLIKNVQRTYNAQGQLTHSLWGDGQQWSVGYDDAGLIETLGWIDPATSDNRTMLRSHRGLTGLPRQQENDFGHSRKFTYDVMGRPVAEEVLVASNLLASRSLQYSDTGDMLHVSGNTGAESIDATYTYDAWHRLTEADGPNGYTGQYSYSQAGNVLHAEVSWTDTTRARNVDYQYGSVDPQAVDQLVNVANGSVFADFQYDAAGNMIERSVGADKTELIWDGLNRLRGALTSAGEEAYRYDHAGNRTVALNSDGDIRVWLGEREFSFILQGAEQDNFLHIGVGSTAARVTNSGHAELYYSDSLNNLMFSVDVAENLTSNFQYGPYGEVVKSSGATDHRRQFNGKENDAHSGLLYYGARYYDPLILRWNSADPIFPNSYRKPALDPRTLNLYAFSLNNPVRYFDPDGREADGSDDAEDADDLSCQTAEPDTCDLDDEETEESAEEESCDSETASCESNSSQIDPNAAAASGGILIRIMRKLGKSVRGRVFAAYLNSRGGKNTFDDKGSLERKTKTQAIQKTVKKPSAPSRVGKVLKKVGKVGRGAGKANIVINVFSGAASDFGVMKRAIENNRTWGEQYDEETKHQKKIHLLPGLIIDNPGYREEI